MPYRPLSGGEEQFIFWAPAAFWHQLWSPPHSLYQSRGRELVDGHGISQFNLTLPNLRALEALSTAGWPSSSPVPQDLSNSMFSGPNMVLLTKLAKNHRVGPWPSRALLGMNETRIPCEKVSAQESRVSKDHSTYRDKPSERFLWRGPGYRKKVQ